jgi:sugar phosphate isomerase/epimerase
MNPTSLTVSLVPEAKGGPFILWDPLPVACRKAKELGYDAIEVFPPSAEGVDAALLEKCLKDNGILDKDVDVTKAYTNDFFPKK